ncbi:MAG: InlB B-repeat-containing protein [Thermoplasmata archaeon]|nr:InlB B-repeat-containing protein [Thermoplasmata archaeon]
MRSRSAAVLVLMMAVALATVVLPTATEDSEAVTAYTAEITVDIDKEVEINLNDLVDDAGYFTKAYNSRYMSDLPDGMYRDGIYLRGTPTEVGEFTFRVNLAYEESILAFYDATLTLYVTCMDLPDYYTVTYDAGIGLVNGSSTWSEQITGGTYASLPAAVHSTGAYTFVGWSLYESSTVTVDSYQVSGDVTLYAVWERNTVGIQAMTATVSQDQTSRMAVVTDPTDAAISISDLGGLSSSNAYLSGRVLVLNMTDVAPGTYYVTISASSTGYYTGTATVTVYVPIVIVKPIEYTLSQGDLFSYTPVTNPTNASIQLVSVTIDGTVSDDHGLEVNGRTITGTLDTAGTYEIRYRAYMDGYVDVTNTVIVYVYASGEVPSTGSVSLASVSASSRASEPRVYDFVAIGGENVSNYVWSIDGEAFASSSSTALYEFPSSGVYTVECTAYGFDGSSVTLEVTVICTDNYHREAAWSGVEYSYIVSGQVEVTIGSGSPFSYSYQEIGGARYTVVSGTPSESDVGSSFEITVGDDSWSITVYGAETQAPTASFEATVSGYTVSVVFSGIRASLHAFDFDNDGVYDEGTSFTYSAPGRYLIVCMAANNVSEVSSSLYVEVAVTQGEDTTLEELTDFHMGVDERMYVSLDLEEGDSLSVSGSAASFVTVDGWVLRFAPTEAGVFDLTVTVTHSDGTADSKTIEVTVKDNSVPKDDEGDYTLVMVALFLVSVGAISLFLVNDVRVKSGKPSLFRRRKGKGRGSSNSKNTGKTQWRHYR